jgi:hypothetical protein
MGWMGRRCSVARCGRHDVAQLYDYSVNSIRGGILLAFCNWAHKKRNEFQDLRLSRGQTLSSSSTFIFEMSITSFCSLVT